MNAYARILLIEDNPGDARLIREILAEAHCPFQIECADTLLGGLERLEKNSFGVLLLDLGLPDSQGLDTFKVVFSRFPHIPIIVLSGLENEEVATQAVRKGAQDYIMKSNLADCLLYKAIRYAMERKRVLEALEASEKKFRLILDSVGEIVYSVSVTEQHAFSNVLDYLSRQVETILGYSPEEILSDPRIWYESIHPEDLQGVTRHTLECIKEKRDLTRIYRLRRKDKGEYRWLEDRIVPQIGENGEVIGLAGVARDITERLEAEEELRENEEKYRVITDTANDAIIMMDSKGDISFWNHAAERIFGYSAEEAIGLPLQQLLVPEEFRDKFSEGFKNFLSTGQGPVVGRAGEVRGLRKDGRGFPAEVSVSAIGLKGSSYTIGIVRDISDRKKLEAQLLRAQRMESIGELAGGIAHDLNNVLTPILMSIELLKESLTDDEAMRILQTLETSTRRGADLVKQILSFARGVPGERKPVELLNVVNDIGRIMEQTFPKNIKLNIEVPKTLWPIKGDATQLHQLLMNLCVNARDAMPEGGDLNISVENLLVDERYAGLHVGVKLGSYVLVSVSDTGAGIPAEVLDRVFEPFFTTKGETRGTGLGLSIVYSIVKTHGGFVDVYSEPDRGSKFKVYLPSIEEPVEAEGKKEVPEVPQGQGELHGGHI